MTYAEQKNRKTLERGVLEFLIFSWRLPFAVYFS